MVNDFHFEGDDPRANKLLDAVSHGRLMPVSWHSKLAKACRAVLVQGMDDGPFGLR